MAATTGAASERARLDHAGRGEREALPPDPSRIAVLVTLSSLILVSLALRWKGIGVTNLWFDEGNSWYVAHLSWGALIDNIRASPLGPLYFAFLGRWMAIFGDSEAALRTPSLIASLLVIPITYAIGVRVFTRRAALVAAALLAVSPLHLYFAQEARMYMPLTFMAALAALLYLRWRNATFAPHDNSAKAPEVSWSGRPRSGALFDLVSFTLVCTAMVHTNIVSVAFIAALWVDAIILIVRHRRGAVGWFLANAFIALTLLIYAREVKVGIASATQEWRGSPGFVSSLRSLVEYPLVALHGVYFYPRDFPAAAGAFQQHGGIRDFLHMAVSFVVQPLALIVVVLLLGAAASGSLRGSRRVVTLAVVVPLLLGTVVSASHQLDLARYFLFASPFLYLLLGHGVTRLFESEGEISGTAAFALLLLASAIGIRATHRVQSRDSDYRPVAGAIMRAPERSHSIYVLPDQAAEPLAYYLRHDSDARMHAARSAVEVTRALFEAPKSPVWLVLDYRSPLYDEPPATLEANLDAELLQERYYAAGGGGVRLLLLRHAPVAIDAPSN